MNWFRRLAKLIGCYVRLSNAASACGFFGLGRLLCCVFCFSFLLTSCILLRAQLVAVKTGAAAAWSEVRIARARLPKMAMRTDCLSKVGWLRPALRDLQLELLVLHAVLLVLWIPLVLLDLAGSFFLSFRLSKKKKTTVSILGNPTGPLLFGWGNGRRAQSCIHLSVGKRWFRRWLGSVHPS